jgi:cytochrome c-type biogenesis protein
VFINRQKRFEFRPSRSSYPASLLIGLIFAIGWTPCVGLILGPILGMAASAATLVGINVS